MADSASSSPASLAHDFQDLSLNSSDSEEQPRERKYNIELLESVRIEEYLSECPERHGVIHRSFWDDIECWMQSEMMQQHAKEIRKEQWCQDGWGVNLCAIEESQYLCRAADCQICVDLNYFLYIKHEVSTPRGRTVKVLPRSITTDLYSIQSSCRNGCQNCAIIYRGIKAIFMESASIGREISPYKSTEVKIHLQDRGSVVVSILGDSFEFYSEYGCSQPLEPFGVVTAMPWKPSPEYCAEFIRGKLEGCFERHSCGHGALAPKLPKRVLDIGTVDKPQLIRLIETNDECEGGYVALSHCWGQPSTVMTTTRGSLQDRLHSIEFEDMPPTFRDSVLIARSLGIRYLWIDSLCILQDDKLDWEIESSKMADVYSNCTLCISATASADSNGGCLFDRWTNRRGTPIAARKMQIPVSTSQSVFVRLIADAAHSIFFTDIEKSYRYRYSKSALLKRAWAFQERILSPRTVHFHEEEMVWECCTSTTCECGRLEWFEEGEENRQRDAWKGAVSRLFYKSRRRRSPLDVWLDLIEEYSTLLITHETDRLPALAGLANRLSQVTRSDYLAGFWKTDLVRSLCWARGDQAVGTKKGGTGDTRSTRHPAPTSIPSWSWASIKPESGCRPLVIEFPWRRRNYSGFDVDKGVEILAASCTESGANKFGNISGGFIRIRGALLRVTLSHKHDDGDIYSVVFGRDQAYFDLDVDCVKCEPDVLDCIYCLFLGFIGSRNPNIPSPSHFAVVVREVATDTRTFERVGFIEIETSKAWFKSAVLETITLI